MSTQLAEVRELRATVSQLQRALDALSLRVVDLESRLSTVAVEGWELVEDSAEGPSLGFYPPSRYSEVESGPPDIPPVLLNVATRLSSAEPGSVVRAKRAFACGFYARCALETFTPYTGASVKLPFADTVWVVLRVGNSFSYRVSTKADLNRLLAIRGAYQPIFQGFPSATEVQIFCAGCNIEVPPLFKWKKP